jgi:hypothetical protein
MIRHDIAGCVFTTVAATLLALLLSGCAPDRQRTPRDDFRSSCLGAARWHALATERAEAGRMDPQTFAAIDDAYDQVVETCRWVLAAGTAPSAAERRTVVDFVPAGENGE